MNWKVKKERTDIFLFEYGDAEKLNWNASQIARFEAFLEEIWLNRSQSGILAEWYQTDEEPANQPLLQIKHRRKGSQKVEFWARAANFVGVIRFEDYTFHLLPKVFKNHNPIMALKLSNAHLLWWLSYNRWLNLPKQVTSLSYQRSDFLEILIHLFATYTLSQLHKGVYQTYQEVEAETSYLKGQLLFSEYTSNYLGRANYQKMYCRYDSFEMDNQLNRIIKFVSHELRSLSAIPESRNALGKIINLLSEVRDTRVGHQHCDQVVLNSMFSNYQMVLDYCKMFLQGQQTQTNERSNKAFAFLVPMEKVFEEFVLGFLDRELTDTLKVTGQYQRKYLTTNNRFRLRPDLYITKPSTKQSFIADSKYKLTYGGDHGISQSDLYQMLAYAVRHKAKDIKLFYPHWEGSKKHGSSQLSIKDEFTENTEVDIEIHQLHVLTTNHEHWNAQLPISKLFEDVKTELISELKRIFTTY